MKRPVFACVLACILPLALAAQAADASAQMGTAVPGLSSITQPTINPFGSDAALSPAAGIGSAPTSVDESSARAALAMVSPDYPVTPGDVYILSFITAQGLVTSTLIVGMGNLIDMANLGKLDASGMLYADAKRLIEARVLAAYELSAPQLIIAGCGTFPVYTRGEVGRASTVYCWGLTRLSGLWPGVTAFASNRDVRISGVSGAGKTYDLFRVWRYGDLSQDPLLRPFDVVSFGRYDRQVSISGEVRRPGTYQLLPGQSLKDLVEIYADGFTDKANPARLTLSRYQPGAETVGSKALLDYAAKPDFALESLDAIAVPQAQELLPVVYFEGALGVGVEGSALQAANRLPYTFLPGETLAQAVQRMKDKFSPVSDLPNAYIMRAGQRLPVNIANFIYGKDFSADLPLVKNDVIIIPFRQFFVSVAGAVMVPGRYPYVPDRNWEYYVGLAGGIDEDKNTGQTVYTLDLGGARYGKDRMIQPEDTIVVAANSFIYQFGRVSSILGTVISVAAVVISIINLK